MDFAIFDILVYYNDYVQDCDMITITFVSWLSNDLLIPNIYYCIMQ